MESQDPNVDEIRSVFRLVNACCERWDDPDGWQEELLGGVKDMLGFGVSMLQLINPGTDKELPEMLPIASMGWKTAEDKCLYLDSIAGKDRPVLPNIDKMIGPEIAEGSVSFTRPMIVSDEVWYESEFYQKYVEPISLDEWTASFRFVPQLGAAMSIGGSRDFGADPMPTRLIKLIGILGEEIAPLLGTRLSLNGQVSRAGLTLRQRQTLELLIDGLSEKQVATELGLSKATVHDYVVRLHKHFDVSSRGELLSYFIKRKPKDSSEA